MVSEFEAAERMMAVCPGFQLRWQQHLEFDEGQRFGAYVDLAVLAEWVVDQLIEDNLECMPALFTEVEALLQDASTDVRNLVVIGLLEDIQYWLAGDYGDKTSGLDPDRIVPFLGPNTKTEWFWLVSKLWDRREPKKWRGRRS